MTTPAPKRRQIGGSKVTSRPSVNRAAPTHRPGPSKLMTLPYFRVLAPTSGTASGPHRAASRTPASVVNPSTGHVQHPAVTRGTGTKAPATRIAAAAVKHPAINKPVKVQKAPKPPKGLGGKTVAHRTVVAQLNQGGSTPSILVAGQSSAGGFFRNIGSGDLAGGLGLTWVKVAEILALVLAGYLVYRHMKGGKRGAKRGARKGDRP